MDDEIELWKAKPQNEDLKMAKPETLANNENGQKFDKNLKTHNFDEKVMVLFDPNPGIWSSEKNRIKKAKP